MTVVKRVALGILVLLCLAASGLGVVLGTANFDHPDTPYPDIKASTDPAVIQRGEYVAKSIAHCAACHQATENVDLSQGYTIDFTAPLSGGYTIKAGPFGTFVAANITPDQETGIGRYTDAEVARAIREGIAPSGKFAPMMRLAVGPMSDEDLTAVVSYLRAQPPVSAARGTDEFGPIARLLSGKFNARGTVAPKHAVAADEPSVERGDYLVNGPALCAGCHSPLDPMAGFALSGPVLSGQAEPDPDPLDETMEVIAPNLTPDPKTGWSGRLNEDGFVARLNAGRSVSHSPMPWEAFVTMTESDKRSIYRYLKTVPAVVNDVGPSHRKAGWSRD